MYPRLWRFCLLLTGNQERGKDLAQATCLRALEKHQQFQVGSHLDRWLFVMARRIWLNDLRGEAVRQGHGVVDDIDLPDERPGSETNILVTQVLKEIAVLPETQRITVILVYVEGYRYAEAAAMLEVPMGTIMSRLAAARKRISLQLGDQDSP